MTDTDMMETPNAESGVGTAEVHTRLSSHPESGERADTRWRSFRPDMGGVTDAAERVMEEARERAERLRARAGDIGARAGRLASEARERVDDVFETVDRARIPERTQSYPLAALGLAVGAGFLLAGRSDNRVLRTVKAQLRAALVAGIVASLRADAEGLVRDELRGLFGRHTD